MIFIFFFFIAIIISGMVERDNISLESINNSVFLQYLTNYIQIKDNATNNFQKMQQIGLATNIFVTKAIVMKTVAEVIAFVIFPPLGVAVDIGFWTLTIPVTITYLLNRPIRDDSSQAVVIIVLQRFLLSAQNIPLI